VYLCRENPTDYSQSILSLESEAVWRTHVHGCRTDMPTADAIAKHDLAITVRKPRYCSCVTCPMLVLHHNGNKTLFLIPAHRISGTVSVSIKHSVPVFGGLARSRRNGPSDRTPLIDTWLNVQCRDISLMLV
jgi:hypothetical protein